MRQPLNGYRKSSLNKEWARSFVRLFVRGFLAASLLTGVLSTMLLAGEGPALAAGGANKPVLYLTGVGTVAPNYSTKAGTTTGLKPPSIFNVMSLVNGGSAKADPASLTIVTKPPVADGTVTTPIPAATKTATAAYITLTPVTGAGKLTQSFSTIFGICAAGIAVYNAATATCTTGTLHYGAERFQYLDQYKTIFGVTASDTCTCTTAFTTQLLQGNGTAAAPTLVTKGKQFAFEAAAQTQYTAAATGGHAIKYFKTNAYIFDFTGVIAAATKKIKPVTPQPTPVRFGGTKVDTKATAKLCTAAVTGCDAKINTGNFHTTYPYIEIEYKTQEGPKSDITWPTAGVIYKATGPLNSVATLAQTQGKDDVSTATGGVTAQTQEPSHKTKKTAYFAATPMAFIKIVGGTITGATPPTGSTAGGYQVIIKGTHLTTVTPAKVTWAGALIPVATIGTIKATEVVIKKVPLHAPGTVPVTLGIATGTKWTKPNVFKYLAGKPVLTTIVPTKGKVAGGTGIVTLTGTNLTGVTKVTFGGTVIPAATFTSKTAVKIVLKNNPAHVAGVVKVVATNVAGASNTLTYTYVAAPHITTIVPTKGKAAGGTGIVTLTGTSLTTVTKVTFGGTSIPKATFTSETTLKIVLKNNPAHAAGPVNVKATGPFGASNTVTYTYVAAPHITTIAPASGKVAGGTGIVTLTGTALTTVTKVTFGGTSIPKATFTSETALKIVLKNNPAHAAGPVNVKATGPFGVSNTVTYTYVAVPHLTTIAPASGKAAGGTGIVTLTGTALTTVTKVTFGGTVILKATFTSETALKIVLKNNPAHAAGPVNVKATGPFGASNTVTYTYVAAPHLTTISPNVGKVAGGTGIVTLSGTALTTVTKVTFGGTVILKATFTSETALKIVLKNNPAHAAGVVNVKATGPFGASNTVTYTYVLPTVPTITTITPNQGKVAGGTGKVTLTGTALTTVTKVTFGGTVILKATFTSETALKIVLKNNPAHAAGPVNVKATGPGGASNTVTYTYFAVPHITTIAPASGKVAGGTGIVTLTGSALTTVTKVTFGGTVILKATFTSETKTKIVLKNNPAHAAGPVNVKGTGPFGVSNTVTYTYVAAPHLTTIAPASGKVAGGTGIVTLTGSALTTVTKVTFGGTVILKATFTSETKTKIVLKNNPAHIAGPVNVKATGPFGVSNTVTYTYVAAPHLTTIAPASGKVAGGTGIVTLTGSALTTVTKVTFGGTVILKATFTSESKTKIVLKNNPGHAAGPVNVKATGPFGASNTVTYTYVAVPHITSIAPSSGKTTGGTGIVTLSGSALTTVTKVTFGGTVILKATFTSETKTKIVLLGNPAHAAGPVNVKGTGPFGVSNTVTYTYVAAPHITTIAPASGKTAGGTGIVTLTGSALTTVTKVTFGGTVILKATFTSETKTKIVLKNNPAHAAGPVNVKGTGPFGASNTVTYTYVAAPHITTIAPASGKVAGGTGIVTLTGSALTTVTKVTFGGTVILKATFTSETKTKIVLKNNPAHAAGPVNVKATGPFGASNTVTYTYVVGPHLTTIVPSSGKVAGGTGITLTGSSLTTVTKVTFGGILIPAATFTSETAIKIVLKNNPTHAAGPVNVKATSPLGTSNAVTFTYVAAPHLTTIAPASGKVAGGTGIVTLTGTALTSVTKVTFGGTVIPKATFTSETAIKIVLKNNPAHAAGPVNVKATGPFGASNTVTYTYVAAPHLTTIAPNHGKVAGGTGIVTLTGSALTTVTKVTFGGTVILKATFTSETKTKIVLKNNPGHAAGPVNVKATGPFGASNTVTYTYLAPTVPTLSTITPNQGKAAGGTGKVTLTGTALTTVTKVTFGGTVILKATFTSETALNIVLKNNPAHAAGPVNVKATSPAGSSNTVTYTYFAVPHITSIAPSSGKTAGGTGIVTLSGSALTTVTKVTFGGTVILKATFTSETKTKIVLLGNPAHAAGVVNVKATGPFGASNTVTYTYVAAPHITTIAPASGKVAGGTGIVTLSGSALTTVTKVTFGGTVILKATFTSETKTKIVLKNNPAHAAGPVGVKATGPFGASNTVTYTYVAAPHLTTIAPASGKVAGGTGIATLTGTALTTVTKVTFGGTTIPSGTFTSETKTTIVLKNNPAHAPGPVNVKATGPFGASNTVTYTYVAAPHLTTIAPSSGKAAGGTGIVTLTGSALTTVTKVTFGGTVILKATFTSETKTKIVLKNNPAHAAGPVNVKATGPFGASNTVTYTYVAAPHLTTIAPNFGKAAGGTGPVTLIGSALTTVTKVTFGGTTILAATFSSETALTIFLKNNPAHAAGPVGVKATGPFGASNTVTYTYLSPTAPVFTTITPNQGKTAGGTGIVTLIGSALTVVTSVTFGGTVIPKATFTSETTTKIVLKNNPPHAAGPVTVKATSPAGSSNPVQYTYVSPPHITAIGPTSGKTAGGTGIVTLTGTGLTTVTKVTFGGTVILKATFTSETKTKIVLKNNPAHAAGAVNVKATGPFGASNTFTYTYVAPTPPPPPPPAGSVPSAPVVTATAQDRQVEVTWTVPANNGQAITSFTITPIKDGVAQTPIVVAVGATISATAGATDSFLVKNLTNAPATYTFSVSATNSIGAGTPGMSGPVQGHSGFWMAAADGGVFNFGNAKLYGSMGGKHLNKPIVGIAPTPDNKGYYLVASDGGIFAFGDAKFHGSMGNKHLNKPVVGMTVTPTGRGYWMVASDGGIFSFGTARFFGSTGNIHLNKPINGMAVKSTGHGYWMVASDGGIFSFGKAKSFGSVGSKKLPAPVTSMAATRDGKGYWELTADGHIYHFGDAKNFGTIGSAKPTAPLTGIATSVNGQGYWVSETNGVIRNYGDAEKFKAIGKALNSPVVSMAPMS